MEKIKVTINSFRKIFSIKEDIFVVIIIIFVGFASFGLGRLSSIENTKPTKILSDQSVKPNNTENREVSVKNSVNSIKPVVQTATVYNPTVNPLPKKQEITQNNKAIGKVLASKSGKRYYYPNCSGVSRIKEENIVWFDNSSDAEAKGLTLAANCQPN